MILVAALIVPSVASANPAGAWAAKFIGEYFLGKAIDELFDSVTGAPDLRELDSRLRTFETALVRVDAQLGRQVAQLRRELSTKVTREQVQAIVNDTLAKLEARTKELEARQDKIDVRIREIEEAFGYLPTVPPSPLLRTTVSEGEPAAHPLTVEWAKLLTRCESSRLQIEAMSRELTDENDDLIAARKADDGIKREIAVLHGRVKTEMGGLVEKRTPLLKKYKPTHREVRLHDDNIASMAWLLGVTKPVGEGRHAGRLVVPSDLISSACSDILAAFEFAKADVTALVPLFRQLLSVKIEPVGDTPQALPLEERIVELIEQTGKLSDAAREQYSLANQTQRELSAALKEFSGLHPKVVELRKQRTDQLTKVRRLHEQTEKLLDEALAEYVNKLKTNRPTNSRMLEFRKQSLLPLKDLAVASDCADWNNRLELDTTWDRFLKFRPVPILRTITNSIGMKLGAIPAENFLMGSPLTESDRSVSEGPQHAVTISRPFHMGLYEVTQGEYEKVMGTNPSYFSHAGDGAGSVAGIDTNKFPVESVSWTDALEFCRKLSKLPEEQKAGRQYRLPTEAEWEYACRAGTTTPFHFGSVNNGREANIDGSYPFGTTTKGPYLKRPTTVGSYAPNAFGLHDMHGNVWEWCQDYFDEKYYAKHVETDPQGPSSGTLRVLRGGSWYDRPRYTRSAFRYGVTPDNRDNYLGFRVVCE